MNTQISPAPGTVHHVQSHRRIRIGDWNNLLLNEDHEGILSELRRVVASHRLVRSGRNHIYDEGHPNSHDDLTQELYQILFSKNRFEHYLLTGMTDRQIEAEISQIELSNLMTTELRHRNPESYRISRRVSVILKEYSGFRLLTKELGPHSEKLYGLSEWPIDKLKPTLQEIEDRTKVVPILNRDSRLVGCSGDSQLIISNNDLKDLIVRLFKAIDGPMTIRSVRNAVINRLVILDAFVYSMDSPSYFDGCDDLATLEFECPKPNPEQLLLSTYCKDLTPFVQSLFGKLHKAVKGKSNQYRRILMVLYHCYLSNGNLNQMEVAAKLGVSDSTVSDYRKRISKALQELAIEDHHQGRMFQQQLTVQLSEMVN